VSGTFNDTVNLRVVVGEIRAQDPIPDGQPGQYWAYDECDTLYDRHPEFGWVEINGIGTQVTLADDQTVTINLPAGLSWQYYGQVYNQLSICGNGFIAPGATTTSTYTNIALPSVLMPPCVALLWDDMYPPTGNGVWYYHDQANGRFIVEYDSIAYYANQAQRAKFEFILYDTVSVFGNNAFVAQYLECYDYSSITVGTQDPTLSTAIQCLFDGTRHRGAAPLGTGRAIYYCDQAPLTGLEEGGTARVPAAFRAWPNPFRGTVSLAPAAAGITGASVYDRSGRLVRSIVGTGPLVWDGRDQSGRLVAPGIYFCRATGTGRATDAKLVLTR
jgi:hypothetical protein